MDLKAFSVLEWDPKYDKLQGTTVAKIKGDSSGESKNDLEFVWIDMEMTGLDDEVDRILEIACVLTDVNLAKSIEGPDLVMHQSKECMDGMDERKQTYHGSTGLIEKVLQSSINKQEAEKKVIDFVKQHVRCTSQLAGNSIYVIFGFLKKHMPQLAALFSPVLIDVSTVKALCLAWCPREYRKAPKKKHGAMSDIKKKYTRTKIL